MKEEKYSIQEKLISCENESKKKNSENEKKI